MIEWRWLAICLLVASDSPSEPIGSALVVTENLEMFASPRFDGYSTGRLRKGESVVAYRAKDNGWAEIDPPPGSVSWMDEADLAKNGDGTYQVVAEKALIRPGRAGAKLPGPPRAQLRQGAVVRAMNLEPIAMTQGDDSRVWVAIEPPPGERRYVRSDGLSIRGPGSDASEPALASPVRRASRFGGSALNFDPALAAVAPPSAKWEPPPNLAADLKRIEDRHRRILMQPAARWSLDSILADYRALHAQAPDPATQAALAARMDHVNRQIAFARAVGAFESQLQKSRDRDRQLAEIANRLKTTAAGLNEGYDAEGVLQNSARSLDGERLAVLIGAEGTPIGYLRVPPALAIKPYIGRRVGVRGQLHYEESLRSRLIDVQDLEPIDGP
jgi:hypothetical protein